MLGVRTLGTVACVGLVTGCLTPRQTAVVGGSGVALSVVSFVALRPVECGAVVEGDDGDCRRANIPVGIASGALAIPLLAGAVINLLAGPVTPPPREVVAVRPPPSRARDLMASAGNLARRGDCVGARVLVARAHADDPAVATSYAGAPEVEACLDAAPE